MATIEWDEVSEAAAQMMGACRYPTMLSRVEEVWRHLSAAGLADHDTDLKAVEVRARLAGVCSLCFDFATVAWDESEEAICWVDWITALEIDPTHLGLLLGPGSDVCESSAEHVQRDAMRAVSLSARVEVVKCLCQSLGVARAFERFLAAQWDADEVVEEYLRRESSLEPDQRVDADAAGRLPIETAWDALVFSEMTDPEDPGTVRAWGWWSAGARDSYH